MRHGAPFRLSLAVGLAFVGLSAAPPGAVCEEAPATSIADLGALSIEELANIPVVSVSKRPESLSGAPAAIFVITQDDIRRSGATSIAEILRLAPNLQVAQLSASTYAITARGFNQPSATANKLLVLIDGRVAYSPLFSGVFWDQQNLPVSDIDRIEVISGPAGTLWGENAVNGVINIITKRADDAQGSLFEADAGVRGDTFTARHGGELGADASYRVYILGLRDNHLPELDGSTGRDGRSACLRDRRKLSPEPRQVHCRSWHRLPRSGEPNARLRKSVCTGHDLARYGAVACAGIQANGSGPQHEFRFHPPVRRLSGHRERDGTGNGGPHPSAQALCQFHGEKKLDAKHPIRD